jgi:formylglycine-generating enzyme required for sulfatase activity
VEGTALTVHLFLIALALGLGLAMPPALGATEAGVVRIEAQVRGKPRFGSGFVVRADADGAYVVTAAHVVEGDSTPKLYFHSRPHRSIPARVLSLEGGDPRGLALLGVESTLPKGVAALPMAKGAGLDLRPGEAVSALGIPASLRNWAVIPGAVVSWKNRNILFSGAVDEGNSGGPLVRDGAVVGLVTGRGERFGVAVPAMSARIFLQSNRVFWASGTHGEPSGVTDRPKTPQRPKAGETFRDTLRDGSKGPQMVVIPAGSFATGSPEGEKGRFNTEGPVHTVRFDRPFAIAKHEVTFDQWEACVRAGGCEHRPDDEGWGRGHRPVINMSWHDAQAYVAWLSKETGQGYRLPSEAEWEYAARAGTQAARHWGEDPDRACDYANVADNAAKRQFGWTWVHKCDDGFAQTAPAGSFKANKFRLQDMLGNVVEWTEDCWNSSYVAAPDDGSTWAKGNCERRVLRGGSWNTKPGLVRAAVRGGAHAAVRTMIMGFRPARTY